MSMERTSSFKDLISELEKRPDLSFPLRNKNRILKNKHDPIEKLGKEIVGGISRLKKFLVDNRDSYLDIFQDNQIGDVQRDNIDSGANKFIQDCNGLIQKFKKELKNLPEQNINEQRRTHLDCVCDILEKFLKSVCLIYTHQKAIRVERETNMQRLYKLEFNARKENEIELSLEDRHKKLTEKIEKNNDNEQSEDGNSLHSNSQSGNEEDKHLIDDPSSSDNGDIVEESKEKKTLINEHKKPVIQTINYIESSEEELANPEEHQMLEEENKKLFENLMESQDEVQQIEKKVVKIAELQDIFTQHVLEQKETIDMISERAVNSTENIKDGNEEIRKAIQNQASVRIYVLFFLLVMSFSLLFLDWYNP